MQALILFLINALLLPCPDCGKDVSSRAVLCPGCGCPGAAIAEAAEKAQSAEEEIAPEPDRFLRVETDRETFFALPVEMKDGCFAVMPVEKALGVQTLTLTPASTNTPIAYQLPQISPDTPLIRFPIAETNLTYWCATDSFEDAKVLSLDSNARMTFSGETTQRAIAFVSPATNLVAIISRFPSPVYTIEDAENIGIIGGTDGPTAVWITPDTPMTRLLNRMIDQRPRTQKSHPFTLESVPYPAPLGDAITWQPIQPRVLREQGATLLKIIGGERPELPPDYWLHPVFQALYTSLTQTGSPQ